MNFLKKNSEEFKQRQKNTLLPEGQSNPYVKIVAAFEHALHEDSATPLSKPLRTHLQADRERRMNVRRKQVLVAPGLKNLLSPMPSVGSPLMVSVPSTVPSTILLDVTISSAVPTLSAQSSQALPTGSPGHFRFSCMQVTEDDPFVHEMCSRSTVRVATTANATAVAMTETERREAIK